MIILAVFALFANKSDDLKVISNLFVGIFNEKHLITGRSCPLHTAAKRHRARQR